MHNGEEPADRLAKLRKELLVKNSNWQHLQLEWAPSYKTSVQPPAETPLKPTYMNHVMAEALHVTPTRSKCLFQAAVSQMVPRRRRPLDAPTVPTGISSGDKFSLDVSATNTHEIAARNIPEFSRFLLFLSGDFQLAAAADPFRDVERSDVNILTAKTRHDGIIKH